MKHNWRSHQLALSLAVSFCVTSQGIEVSTYGFLKAGVVAASRAVESFGNANLSAPNKAYATNDNVGRTSFQLSQTRIGLHIGKKDPISGQLEFDFIDFDKASPVVKAMPRLRIAMVRYAVSAHDTLGIGQDWDVFSPGKPHTLNFVGLYFGAGNAGFIRPQLKWTHHNSEMTAEAALGLPGSNPTASDSDLEKGILPSLSAMLAYTPGEGNRLGVSAILGRLRFTSGSQEAYGGFYGLNAFYEQPLGNGAELHGELYYGENLYNTGALTLAQGTFGESRHEWGGYVTVKSKLIENLSGQLGIGFANVLESNGSTMKNITGFRVLDNLRLAATASYRVGDSLDFYVELAALNTRYHIDPAGGEVSRLAGVLDTGAVFWF